MGKNSVEGGSGAGGPATWPGFGQAKQRLANPLASPTKGREAPSPSANGLAGRKSGAIERARKCISSQKVWQGVSNFYHRMCIKLQTDFSECLFSQYLYENRSAMRLQYCLSDASWIQLHGQTVQVPLGSACISRGHENGSDRND
jgi:hypothetical protein